MRNLRANKIKRVVKMETTKYVDYVIELHDGRLIEAHQPRAWKISGFKNYVLHYSDDFAKTMFESDVNPTIESNSSDSVAIHSEDKVFVFDLVKESEKDK